MMTSMRLCDITRVLPFGAVGSRWLTVALLAAQLPPMINSYMPYGGMPIVPGPPVVNSPPMVSRPSLVSGPPMVSGPPIMSGPPMLPGPPALMSSSSIVSDLRDDSCVVRCVRQCQNDQSPPTVSNIRTVGVTSFMPNQGGNSGNAFSNVGMNSDFPSGLSSEPSRLSLSPSSECAADWSLCERCVELKNVNLRKGIYFFFSENLIVR